MKKNRFLLSETVLQTLDPAPPALAIHAQKTYVDSMASTIYALYQTQRAYRYQSLSTDNPLSDSLSDRPLPALTHADLDFARTHILDRYHAGLEAHRRRPQTFPALHYPLSSSDITTLRKQGGAFINIPAANGSTPESKNPFFRKSDVRLSKVRLFLPGIATKSGFLLASLTHQGSETFVDENDASFTFYHKPITVDFKYRTSDLKYGEDVPNTIEGEIGLSIKDATVEDHENGFANVGPFTMWHASIKGNEGLDWTACKGGYLEFEGHFMPFPG
ncbi:hypothetical protein LTR70_001434 [Exophiala xenobiotica]|uniref:Uncharacterized protein n=1 Tax=Lithohypha guttulata TaxID=1690604 RepID=A0ABR0KM59_9EURO|nr:hypothetical protein LTR24_000812 [Lithohypha guttulata]KAK5328113.1 hypothetical protein LTR70_001434 [Exophiala xenobiotica]